MGPSLLASPANGAGMLADMHEQPALLRGAARSFRTSGRARRLLKAREHTILTGSGSAFHAALVGAALLCRRNVQARAVAASEFDAYTARDLSDAVVISLSQSGGSADVLAAARSALQRGASVIAITNTAGSALGELADIHLELGAGAERAVPATKTVMAMIAALFALSVPRCGPVLSAAAAGVQKALNSGSPWLASHCRAVDAADRVFVLGEGLGYACALECALKLKEAGQVAAEAYATGEFKHGVTVMVRPGCVAILIRIAGLDSQSEGAATTLHRLGAQIIKLGSSSRRDALALADPIAIVSALTALAQAQVLARRLGLSRGLNPDAPPTLQKQVRGWT